MCVALPYTFVQLTDYSLVEYISCHYPSRMRLPEILSEAPKAMCPYQSSSISKVLSLLNGTPPIALPSRSLLSAIKVPIAHILGPSLPSLTTMIHLHPAFATIIVLQSMSEQYSLTSYNRTSQPQIEDRTILIHTKSVGRRVEHESPKKQEEVDLTRLFCLRTRRASITPRVAGSTALQALSMLPASVSRVCG